MPKYTLIALAVIFAFAGLAVACVDLRDHWTVPPTPAPAGVELAVPADPEPINVAKRSVEDFRYSANTYIDRRNADIAKQEAKVAFIEGAASGGLEKYAGAIGAAAGPFGPLAALLIGYATKRRKDASPDQVAKEKQDSYNKGLEVGKAMAEAVKQA